jgi:hypothetical protein
MKVRPAYMLLLALSFVRCAAPCENEGSLKQLARESVSSQLKAPASAKFSEEEVNPSKDGKGLLVKGVVDAQNGFGAMIREEYMVNVKCNDGQPFVAYAWMGANAWGTEHQAMVDSIRSQSEARMDSIRTSYDARADSAEAR